MGKPVAANLQRHFIFCAANFEQEASKMMKKREKERNTEYNKTEPYIIQRMDSNARFIYLFIFTDLSYSPGSDFIRMLLSLFLSSSRCC